MELYWSTVAHSKPSEWLSGELGGPAVCALYWLALGVEADQACSLSRNHSNGCSVATTPLIDPHISHY